MPSSSDAGSSPEEVVSESASGTGASSSGNPSISRIGSKFEKLEAAGKAVPWFECASAAKAASQLRPGYESMAFPFASGNGAGAGATAPAADELEEGGALPPGLRAIGFPFGSGGEFKSA